MRSKRSSVGRNLFPFFMGLNALVRNCDKIAAVAMRTVSRIFVLDHNGRTKLALYKCPVAEIHLNSKARTNT